MATAKFIALEHHKKADGKINLKLCVYHKSKRAYLATNYTVVESQLKKDYTIKDKDIKAQVLADELLYLKKISELGFRINTMTAKELGEYLTSPKDISLNYIDFIEFSRSYILKKRAQGKYSASGIMQSVINNLVDFTGTEVVYTNTITSKFLTKFEAYLSNPYSHERMTGSTLVKFNRSPMTETSLFTYMNYFRLLFNAARDKYNDLDAGNIIIQNYPFKSYKPPVPKDIDTRSISINTVKLIRDIKCKSGSSIELARDMFMLSFYMLGMNAKDVYLLTDVPTGRVEYNRAKTKDKRRDSAFISVKVIPEAKVLFEKYAGVLKERYPTMSKFRYRILYGTKKMNEMLGVPKFTFYSARHTVATEARNTLGFSVADIGEALNHKRVESRITDTYIKKNWSKLDEIQAGVVALLSS